MQSAKLFVGKGDNKMCSSTTRYQKGLLFLGVLLASGLAMAGGASEPRSDLRSLWRW